MKQHRKLIWHIYPTYLLIIVAALLGSALYTSAVLREVYLNELRGELESYARLFRALFKDQIISEDRQEADARCKVFGAQLNSRLTVILRSGLVIGDSEEDPAKMDNHGDRPEIRAVGRRQWAQAAQPARSNDRIDALSLDSAPLEP